MITSTADARDLSCQALAMVDDSNPDAPVWWDGSRMHVVHHYSAEMQRRHDPHACDLIGCRDGA